MLGTFVWLGAIWLSRNQPKERPFENWPLRFPLNPFNTLRALNDALDVIFNEEDLEQVVQQLTDPEMKLISSLHLIVA